MGKVTLVLLACLVLARQTLSLGCHNVGFSVSLTENVGPSSTTDIVKWDKIFSNVGNAFSLTTGKFTAPVTGTYFFTLSIHKRSFGKAPIVNLLVDGKIIIRVDECCDEDPYDSATNSVLLTLNQGAEVWTQLYETGVLARHTFENTFTGFLVFA